MTNFRFSMFVAAAGLALCAAAGAQVLSGSDYQARERVIAVRYRAAFDACVPLAGQLRDVCVAEADSHDRIARADLEAHYRPSAKARYHALMVAADSRYTLARVRCDSLKDAASKACVAKAKSVRDTERGQAGASLRAAQATARAREQSADDREEGTKDTFAARYAAARQQCDGYVGKLRERCLVQTRDQFIKP